MAYETYRSTKLLPIFSWYKNNKISNTRAKITTKQSELPTSFFQCHGPITRAKS